MKTLLIVDDDRDLRVGLSIRLKAEGYLVRRAEDGAGAMRVALQEAPDLILLDIGMPGGNGFIVLDLLKDSPATANIPVIVLTARDVVSTRDKVLAMGAAAFLQKPVDNVELLKAIRKYAGDAEVATRVPAERSGPASASPHSVEAAGETRAPAEHRARSSAAGGTTDRQAKKTILIVEDDMDLLMGLSIRLRSSGYNVLTARDGAGATATAAKQSPDLMILDIGIPGGDGLVVLERLRHIASTVVMPVIVLTGRDPAVVRDKALALGATAFLQKPVDNAQLLALIRKYTGEGEQEVS